VLQSKVQVQTKSAYLDGQHLAHLERGTAHAAQRVGQTLRVCLAQHHAVRRRILVLGPALVDAGVKSCSAASGAGHSLSIACSASTSSLSQSIKGISRGIYPTLERASRTLGTLSGLDIN